MEVYWQAAVIPRLLPIWEIPTHRHLTIFDGHKGYIRTLAFAPDGKTLASISGYDGTILLWNVPTK